MLPLPPPLPSPLLNPVPSPLLGAPQVPARGATAVAQFQKGNGMYGVLVDGYVADGTITQAEADSLSPTQLEFLIRKRSPTAMGGAAGETTAAAGSKSAAASSSSSAASAEETLIITEAEASPALPCCLRWMGALMAGGLGWLHGASCSACRRGSCSSRRWWVLVTAPHHKQPPIVH